MLQPRLPAPAKPEMLGGRPVDTCLRATADSHPGDGETREQGSTAPGAPPKGWPRRLRALAHGRPQAGHPCLEGPGGSRWMSGASVVSRKSSSRSSSEYWARERLSAWASTACSRSTVRRARPTACSRRASSWPRMLRFRWALPVRDRADLASRVPTWPQGPDPRAPPPLDAASRGQARASGSILGGALPLVGGWATEEQPPASARTCPGPLPRSGLLRESAPSRGQARGEQGACRGQAGTPGMPGRRDSARMGHSGPSAGTPPKAASPSFLRSSGSWGSPAPHSSGSDAAGRPRKACCRVGKSASAAAGARAGGEPLQLGPERGKDGRAGHSRGLLQSAMAAW